MVDDVLGDVPLILYLDVSFLLDSISPTRIVLKHADLDPV